MQAYKLKSTGHIIICIKLSSCCFPCFPPFPMHSLVYDKKQKTVQSYLHAMDSIVTKQEPNENWGKDMRLSAIPLSLSPPLQPPPATNIATYYYTASTSHTTSEHTVFAKFSIEIFSRAFPFFPRERERALLFSTLVDNRKYGQRFISIHTFIHTFLCGMMVQLVLLDESKQTQNEYIHFHSFVIHHCIIIGLA